MDASTKVHFARRQGVRIAASAALLSVMLGACSSVPDAINPVSWYEKTTDFFAGDSQAADTRATQAEQERTGNQGLSADPDAPPPAPAPTQQVASAPGGLSADGAQAGNYASPPIERQGAPSNVLQPQTQTASAPPPPVAAPQVAVSSAPVAAPTPRPVAPAQPQAMPKATDMASAPPSPPVMPSLVAPSASPEQQFAAVAPDAPKTFEFPPVTPGPAFGADDFETVVITADGTEAMAAPAPPPSAPTMTMSAQPSAQPQQDGGVFPEPGATTTGEVGPQMVGGMLRVATIHFANNSSNLDQRDRSILGAVIQLQRERGGRVVVIGHASSRTKDMDYIKHQMVNFEISMQRAGIIGSALKGLGLPGGALEVQAVSDTQPLYQEVMPSGEAGNRRVEIYLAAAAT